MAPADTVMDVRQVGRACPALLIPVERSPASVRWSEWLLRGGALRGLRAAVSKRREGDAGMRKRVLAGRVREASSFLAPEVPRRGCGARGSCRGGSGDPFGTDAGLRPVAHPPVSHRTAVRQAGVRGSRANPRNPLLDPSDPRGHERATIDSHSDFRMRSLPSVHEVRGEEQGQEVAPVRIESQDQQPEGNSRLDSCPGIPLCNAAAGLDPAVARVPRAGGEGT